MPSWSININVNQQQPPRASFSPETQQALVGDVISWANNDPEESHWPAPFNADGTVNEQGWFSQAIPPNAPSEGSISPTTVGKLKYCCALHEKELGFIDVLSSPPATP